MARSNFKGKRAAPFRKGGKRRKPGTVSGSRRQPRTSTGRFTRRG